MGKHPKRRFNPAPSKQPKVAQEPTGYHGMFPSWRIAGMEMVEPWGWHALTSEETRSIHHRLSLFESMTWSQILVESKKQNHSIDVWLICAAAQKRLEELGYGDLDKIVSLRLGGKEREYGEC